MVEGLLLALDILGMLVLIRWSIAQERTRNPPSPSKPTSINRRPT